MILFEILLFLIGHSVKKEFDGFDNYYSSDSFFLDSGWSYDTLILASIQSGNLAIHEAISWSKEDSVVLNIQRAEHPTWYSFSIPFSIRQSE